MKLIAACTFWCISLTVKAEPLPIPPVPPPMTTDTAPVPNKETSAPLSTAGQKPTVAVRLYRSRPYDPSMGFTPGSRYQSTEDRKPIQTPGLSLSLPLP